MSAAASGAFGALSLKKSRFWLEMSLNLIQVGPEVKKASQGQSHGVLVDGVTVFAVVQKGDSKVVLREVGPFVTPNLARKNINICRTSI